MTDEEIRVKIAEVLPFLKGDPINDLNVMHEAEKTLTNEQFLTYCESHLSLICCDESRQEQWSEDLGWTTQMIIATARQRALAFIKTILPT